MLITALRAAETLAAFHRQRIDNATGEDRAYHLDMVRCCAQDARRITLQLATSGVTVRKQANAIRRLDLATAQKIIDRHPIMHGFGIAVEDVGKARIAMARDIADALAAEQGAVTAG